MKHSDIPGPLPREQSIALLQRQKPDAAPAQWNAVAAALGDLFPALQLAGPCWQRYRAADETRSFAGELAQPEPAELRIEPDDPIQNAHARLSAGINNLGRLLHDQADLAAAHEAFSLSLMLDEAALGVHHPCVARDLNKLGTVLHDMGDFDAALQAFERALTIDETALGSQHPCIARDVNNLGVLLRDSGDPASAREAFEWALSICRQTLGEAHEYTRIVYRHWTSL